MTNGPVTLSEVLSQPSWWRATLHLVEHTEQPDAVRKIFNSSAEWIFIGCGSSYYLAQAAAATFVEVGRVRARAIPASEVLLYPEPAFSKAQNIVPVLISRSGKTSEVLKVGAYFERSLGIATYAVTCDGNELKDLSTWLMHLPVKERSTVMTASFTSMLIGLQHMAAVLAGNDAFVSGLRELPRAAEKLLTSNASRIEQFVQTHSFKEYVFLGQGPYFGIASESMLKVMESSSSNAHCFHTLEFRHGPKSIVTSETLVACLISEQGYPSELEVLEEMKQLGATTMVVVNAADERVRNAADLLIETELTVPEYARLAPALLWGQLLGVHTGIAKGLNPDEPRNLSRVVIIGSGRDVANRHDAKALGQFE